jgi:hypothetical protein
MDFFSYLKHDPLYVFYRSKSPIGLYARQKWLYQGDTLAWKNDFRDTVDSLFAGQLPNGSWDDSLLYTVRRLFGLHLTVRNINKRIKKALEWLLSQEVFLEKEENLHVQSEQVFTADLQNLPFSHGCFEHFAKCAILFLATIFGKERDARVIHVYEMLRIIGEKHDGKWCTWSCSNNFLRAFVVHPAYQEGRAVKLYVSRLAEVQRADGSWPIQIPFYQTVNALGHLNLAQSDKQLKRAFKRLREKQYRDGIWGSTQKEWNTFLIVHAIQRKSHLLSMEKIQDSP